MKIKFSKSLKDLYYQLKKIDNLNNLDNYILDEYLTSSYTSINEDIINQIVKNNSHINKEEAFKEAFFSYFELEEEDEETSDLIEYNKLADFKLLDSSIIENNDYFKFISSLNIDNLKSNNIKLERNYYDKYEGFLYDEVSLNSSLYEVNKLGFFDKKTTYYNLIDFKNDMNVWMNITPFEIQTMKEAISSSKGKVLTFGLGLAYYPYMISNNDDVKEITVIENNKEIINFINNNLISKFKNKDKIKIIYEDMYSYIKNNDLSKFDYIFIDTYHQAYEAIPAYFKLLNKLDSSKSKYSFWIEKSILIEIRKYLFILLSFEFEKSLKKEYSLTSSQEDILNILNKVYEDYEISEEKDIYSLLDLKNIKETLIKGKLYE